MLISLSIINFQFAIFNYRHIQIHTHIHIHIHTQIQTQTHKHKHIQPQNHTQPHFKAVRISKHHRNKKPQKHPLKRLKNGNYKSL